MLTLTLQDWLQVLAARLQGVLACKGRATATTFASVVLVIIQVLLQLPHWSVRRV
jgi:hypothetical protein